MHEYIRARRAFEPLHTPQSNILCFRWLGRRTPDDPALDELNRELRERYNRSGRGWLTATVLGGRRVLRVTVMNPRTTAEHVAAMLDGLEEIGRELEAET
jgi:L-2,4-diaminobutyrate decarboxylase